MPWRLEREEMKRRQISGCCGLSTLALSIGLIIVFLFSCSGEPGYKPVDFSNTVPVAQSESQLSESAGLRVAVAAMISPKETFVYYRQLLDYVGERLGYSLQLIQRKTYSEINELFSKGQIELAFICTGPYASGREAYGFEGIATPVVRGQPFYQSYLIVNKTSPYEKLADLRGRDFAFTDPESNTGSLVPVYWLAEIGESPASFFKTLNFTFSHDNSILAVAKGLVDGASVDGHKWEYYSQRSQTHAAMTRVIKKSEPFGSPPLVASVYLPEELKSSLRKLLFAMHADPAGSRILQELMIDRFVAPREEWYEPVKRMVEFVQNAAVSKHVAEKP